MRKWLFRAVFFVADDNDNIIEDFQHKTHMFP